MLSPEQIRSRAARRYVDVLRSIAAGENIFPLVLVGSGMTRATHFENDRRAIQALREQSREVLGFGYEIRWKQQGSRRFDTQNIPASVSIPTRDDYTKLIAKCEEVQSFQVNFHLICERLPELREWALRRPMCVVEYAAAWTDLIAVCQYLRRNGPTKCYIRELPIPVDTKFVERHKTILTELLPIIAPGCVCGDNRTFESRFGFREKQLLLRFRLLDPGLKDRLLLPFSDFAVPLDSAARFRPDFKQVLIVENEMTFLTLPQVPDTVTILGAGDAVARLSEIDWLASVRVVYWGDMDAHGFAALSHLRKRHRHAESLMMDLPTFEQFRTFAVSAKPYSENELLLLTPPEQAAFEMVRAAELLLEQERVQPWYAQERLNQCFSQDI
jgi:hypothetical protein